MLALLMSEGQKETKIDSLIALSPANHNDYLRTERKIDRKKETRKERKEERKKERKKNRKKERIKERKKKEDNKERKKSKKARKRKTDRSHLGFSEGKFGSISPGKASYDRAKLFNLLIHS